MIRSVNHSYLISGAEIAFANYSQVGAGSQRLSKTTNKHLIVHPDSKSPARHPRFGHFEHGGSDLPVLSDQRIIHRDPFRREVLAKLAILERPTELLLPPPHVFNRICVDRFIKASMRLAIRLIVSVEIYTSGLDTTVDR
jgi:hypothetical protein